ncbi:MAG: hypothetical protein WBA16_10745 [Nonlabens sp.]
MKKILFKESQKFRQPWLWVLLITVMGISLFSLIYGYTMGAVDLGTAIPVVFVSLVFLWLFAVMKLETTVNASGIKIKFYPLVSRSFNFDQVREMKVINYGFIGGWGIRLWTGYGTVYNVRGSMGLHFKYRTPAGMPKEYIIGTQRPEELQSIINNLVN